ncbi:UNVERIFIED_CONTAM: hypothetical protein K2H54_004290 [Gekko kuhli]
MSPGVPAKESLKGVNPKTVPLQVLEMYKLKPSLLQRKPPEGPKAKDPHQKGKSSTYQKQLAGEQEAHLAQEAQGELHSPMNQQQPPPEVQHCLVRSLHLQKFFLQPKKDGLEPLPEISLLMPNGAVRDDDEKAGHLQGLGTKWLFDGPAGRKNDQGSLLTNEPSRTDPPSPPNSPQAAQTNPEYQPV